MANFQGSPNELLIKLGSEQGQPGSAAAIIKLVLLDILSDFNTRKVIRKKYGSLDTGMIKSVLQAG